MKRMRDKPEGKSLTLYTVLDALIDMERHDLLKRIPWKTQLGKVL